VAGSNLDEASYEFKVAVQLVISVGQIQLKGFRYAVRKTKRIKGFLPSFHLGPGGLPNRGARLFVWSSCFKSSFIGLSYPSNTLRNSAELTISLFSGAMASYRMHFTVDYRGDYSANPFGSVLAALKCEL
jgi:hypothetical protein